LFKISKSKAMLVKVINGVETDLDKPIEYNFALLDKNNPGFYKFTINYNRDEIDVHIQKDPSLDKTQLFKIRDEYSIKRGHIGFEKKGKPEVKIT